MRFIICAVVALLFSTYAFGVDFSGKWTGACIRNGVETPQKLRIQSDSTSISIEGDTFSLISTTVRNHSGVDEGKEWKEVTVYDWQWNEDRTVINTNARWLGWYENQNGAWSGRGIGYIKMNKAQLETKRTFEIESNGAIQKNEELCKYNSEK